MAEGRSRDAWAHTSAVLAMLFNVNRDPRKSKALMPSDFDPHSTTQSRSNRIPITPENIHLLKALVKK